MACVWRVCGVCAASHVGRLGTRECMYRCHATLERFCDDCIAWDEVAAIGGGPSVRVQRTVCAGGITQMLRSGCMSVLVWLHVGPRVWWGGCWHGGGCLWGCAGVGWVAWCVYRDSDVAPKSAAITGNFILELVVEQLQKERDRRMSGTEA